MNDTERLKAINDRQGEEIHIMTTNFLEDIEYPRSRIRAEIKRANLITASITALYGVLMFGLGFIIHLIAF